jgi:hypothetical protein
VRRSRGVIAAGIALVISGLAALVASGVLDARALKTAPWPNAVFAPQGDPPWDGAVDAWVRRVPINNFPLQRDLYRQLKEVLPAEYFNALPLDKTEWFLSIDLPPQAFTPLLESGRLPRRGTDEVLAGAFARAEFVQVDDGAFHVVGRLKRGTGGLASAYVLPKDEIWEPLWFSTASAGWFDPNGLERIRTMDDPEAFVKRHNVRGGNAPAPAVAVYVCVAGLGIVAVGGALLHQGAFVALYRRAPGVFRPAMRASATHPRLVFFMHVFLYGVFFLSMAPALRSPFLNVMMQEYIRHTFTEGSLWYVGEAYGSGNVIRAAAATWVNNFFVQTAGLTMLLSVIVPMVGVLTTAANFAIAGLGMTPLWSGMPGLFVPHSITMVLELEAYIYACVAVAAFWLGIVRGIREGKFADAAHESAMTLLSATLLAGTMLAVAAAYEAASLLLLAQPG